MPKFEDTCPNDNEIEAIKRRIEENERSRQAEKQVHVQAISRLQGDQHQRLCRLQRKADNLEVLTSCVFIVGLIHLVLYGVEAFLGFR